MVVVSIKAFFFYFEQNAKKRVTFFRLDIRSKMELNTCLSTLKYQIMTFSFLTCMNIHYMSHVPVEKNNSVIFIALLEVAK